MWKSKLVEQKIEGRYDLAEIGSSIQLLTNQIQSLEEHNREDSEKTRQSLNELKETIEVIDCEQKRNNQILVSYGRGNILFIKQELGNFYSDLSECSSNYVKWAYDNEYKPGTYKLWWGTPIANKAEEILFKLFYKYPELFKYIDKTMSGDLKCSITGRKILSIEDCSMHHVILNRIHRGIKYKSLYTPDTNIHIITPILRSVHNKLPPRAMYLDEFIKWRNKYYKG